MISTKTAKYNQKHDRPLGRTVAETKRVWERPANAGDAKLPGMFASANEYFERVSSHSKKPMRNTKSGIDATHHSNKSFEANWSNHSSAKRYARGIRIKNERETFSAEEEDDEEELPYRPVKTVEIMERPSTPKRERRRTTRTPSSPRREQRCVSTARTSLASILSTPKNSSKMNKSSGHQSVATTPSTVASSVSWWSPDSSWSSIGFDGTITTPSSSRRRRYIGSSTPKSPNPNKNSKYISVFSKTSSKPSQSSSSLGTFLTPDSKSRRCDNSTVTTNEDSFANLSLMTPQERVKLIDIYQEEISKRTSPIDMSVADSALYMLRKATLDCKMATSKIIDTYHLSSDDDDDSSDESDSDSDDSSVDISLCRRY